MYSQFINNISLKNQCLLYPKSLSDTPALEETKLPFLECCLYRDIIENCNLFPFVIKYRYGDVITVGIFKACVLFVTKSHHGFFWQETRRQGLCEGLGR